MSSSGEGGSNNSAFLIVGFDLKWRRERIATAVLAGLFTHNNVEPLLKWDATVKIAIGVADALIAELDKP